VAQWGSFVAVGDSFTEGMDDQYPDGTFRGWADLVAARLAADHGPGFRYANLAVRGKLLPEVVDNQLPTALEMRPDLVSFAAGGNDALRRSFDPDRLIRHFDQVVAQIRATGADLVVFQFANVARRLPGKRLIMPRAELLNQAVGESAVRHGAHLVDLWNDDEFADPRLWSVDRLHLSTLGHLRVAAHVLTALGLQPDTDWLATPGPLVRTAWPVARVGDARWVAQHLAPWVKRRLTGRSSGDAVTAKRPTLAPFD
jgi:lysophospholipase L1-like esterase